MQKVDQNQAHLELGKGERGAGSYGSEARSIDAGEVTLSPLLPVTSRMNPRYSLI